MDRVDDSQIEARITMFEDGHLQYQIVKRECIDIDALRQPTELRTCGGALIQRHMTA